MKPMKATSGLAAALVAIYVTAAGCGEANDPKAEAPPAVRVETVDDRNVFRVARPEQFALATAEPYLAARQLRVTGTVAPDVARSVPVVSLAAGRVVGVNA